MVSHDGEVGCEAREHLKDSRLQISFLRLKKTKRGQKSQGKEEDTRTVAEER